MAIRKFVALFVEIVLLGASVLGQSLGDLAREQRKKQNDKPTVTPHKVITDDDIIFQHGACIDMIVIP